MSSLKPYILVAALILPVASIAIGARYLNYCPAENRIPVYLIVRGVVSVILHVLNVVGGFPDVADMVSPCHDTKTKIFMGLNTISLIWFTTGCYWVYGAYEPSFEPEDGLLYCHQTLYYFTFWVVNLSFIVLLVYVGLIAICLSRRSDKAKEVILALSGPGQRTTEEKPSKLSGKEKLLEKGSPEEKVALTNPMNYFCVVDMKMKK